jgi:hypothetical protein
MLIHLLLVRSAKHGLNPTSYQGLTNSIELRWGPQVADKGTLYSQHELFRRVAVILLETDQLRPRVHVTQKTRQLAHGAKVLGRTLMSGRTDAKYSEVAFPSTSISTTAATSLPTPTTAAATTDNAAFAGPVT